MQRDKRFMVSDEIANLFFQQEMDGTAHRKSFCQRLTTWIEAIEEAQKPGAPHDAHLAHLLLCESIYEGKITSTLSRNQGVWIGRAIAFAHRHERTITHRLFFDYRTVGTWRYLAPTTDPLYRMVYLVDPSWLSLSLVQHEVDPLRLDQALGYANAYLNTVRSA